MRHLYSFSLSVIIIIFFSLQALQAQESEPNLILTEPFPGLSITNILGLESPDDSPNIYLLSQQGQVYRLDTSVSGAEAELWLDISGRLVSGGERGLLGLAFPPDYDQTGRFYVYYTAGSPTRTVISRFTANNGTADPDSEEILLEFDQPFNNHNGGKMAFGPDGYLYIASGDGGSGGDPQGNAQNTQNLLGAMLRIDVDTDGATYEIPADNPFVDSEDGLDEIYAWGLRNPWRFSFDRESGVLWTGDVGQNAWEAIHYIENGLNYGWAILEGSNCYPPGSSCDTEGLEMPVFEYDHSQGDRSITGGYVYRGAKNPSLFGQYIYGDFISGRIWALEFDEETIEAIENRELINAPFNISSFGEDADGELYVLAYNSGRVFTIVTTPEATAITQPQPGEMVGPEFTLAWEKVPGADEYNWQISDTESFDAIVFSGLTGSASAEVDAGEVAGELFVRVRTENEAGESDWSDGVPFVVDDPVSAEPITELPREMKLYPAYPNPFNPSTIVSFALPESANVTLEVYNSAGQRVAVLADGMRSEGQHNVTFDGSNLSSGIYIIHLSALGERAVNKVTLIK